MGLDIWVVRGRVEFWPMYDALEDRWERLHYGYPENEGKEARARRTRLERAVLNALQRCKKRLDLPFPPGWDDGYIARGFQIYDTPLYEDSLLWDVYFFHLDRYTPQNWPKVQSESAKIMERYNAGKFKYYWCPCEGMMKVLKKINDMAKWILDTQNPDEYRAWYSR